MSKAVHVPRSIRISTERHDAGEFGGSQRWIDLKHSTHVGFCLGGLSSKRITGGRHPDRARVIRLLMQSSISPGSRFVILAIQEISCGEPVLFGIAQWIERVEP